MPKIAVINESSTASERAVKAMLPAFEHQWNVDLRPVWGVDEATFTLLPAGHAPANGSWWLVFLDDSNQATELAYHDLTSEGLPISKVFVKTTLADHSSLSVGASHELCEMAVDPWINSAYQDEKGVFWAGEICDPVEDDGYGYEIHGVLVTDFITPDWFAHAHASGVLDFKRHARSAFEVLAGGYAQHYDTRRGWVQTTGAVAKASKRAAAAPGTRRERRARQDSVNWKRSKPHWQRTTKA
jgi:hypothetical protein